jgi:hypothetical protein
MKSTFKLGLMVAMAAAVLAVPAFADSIPAPEPSTLAMLASGLGGVLALRHWRKR